jgi:3-dehydroquinate dehydratase-2
VLRLSTKTTILVLHGPSLSLLGSREPETYGSTTLDDINAGIAEEAARFGFSAVATQTNHEGVLIDSLIGASRDVGICGVILNAGAYAHTSLAIADAVRACRPLRVVEVHLTNTASRDAARHPAPVGAACWGRIEGFGALSYRLAVRALVSDGG